MAKLIIDIEDGGATTIKVEGVAGPGCANLTKAIEESLGTVSSDVRTPEFHRAATQQNQAKAGAQ